MEKKRKGGKKGRKKAQVITQKERKKGLEKSEHWIDFHNYHYLHCVSASAGQERAHSRSCTHQTVVCSWAKLLFTFAHCFYLKIFFSVRIHYITALRTDLWVFLKRVWKKLNVKLMSHSPQQISLSRVCIIQLLLHFSKDELNAHPVVSYYYMQSAKLDGNALTSQAPSVFPFAGRQLSL